MAESLIIKKAQVETNIVPDGFTQRNNVRRPAERRGRSRKGVVTSRERTTRNVVRRNKQSEGNASVGGGAFRKAKAIKAGLWALLIIAPIIKLQAALWIVGMGFMSVESWWVIGWLVSSIIQAPEIFFATSVIIGVLGIVSLIIAILVFMVGRVNWYGHQKLLVLFLCLALGFAPIVNLTPFAVFYILYIMFARYKKPSSGTV